MESSEPFFSIIIPMFNTEKYIEDCISSILNQNFCDYEIIIVDDGSTDGSLKIISQYIKGKANIKLFKQNNAGVSAARNVALEKAVGKYIMFMDSDDYLIGESMKYLKNTLLKNSDVDLLFFNYYDVFPNEVKRHVFRTQFLGTGISKDKAIEGILSDIGGYCWNKVYKRSLLTNERFNKDITFLEDMLFNVLAVNNSNKIMCIGNCLYSYRWRKNSIVHTFDLKNLTFFSALKLVEENIPNKFISLINVKRRMAYIEFASNLIFMDKSKYLNFKKLYKKENRLKEIKKFNLSKTERVSLFIADYSFDASVIVFKLKRKFDKYRYSLKK
ncbi:hypothetical protein C5L30_001303 [Companilactobacillus farciminis]|uniref:Glycosyltransferase 2-like domain-containing protein n=1 Tax=Companilactobacillus farciminis TaxID=1612 RepID=A0A4R5NHD2_9LACO|nr:glycosyltransferase family 2 protein [Companilactobacillus farciminis]ATO45703.1 hypothetical protein LF20184_02540 [Companilactobacillus farciminis KCTC 3681 = DSM 20184]KRK62329.1 glycosyl transferase, family 2 [Companilactobacillus farciminis KCTC 3681 = DSM 20184]TDG73811.1 hypothetical protein C5L30_001303 [Companilactobacillus farciminis]